MQLKWKISDIELGRWRSFVEDNLTNDFVKDRQKQNLARKSVDLSKNKLWLVHVGCQVTSMQRSGPNSVVGKFMNSKSKALSYSECVASPNVEKLIQKELSKAGLWRADIIARNLAKILNSLEDGGWKILINRLKTIEKYTTISKEREVASYIAEHFSGIGPKQSRNFIQWLGLARYEIPIDSRMTRTMKLLGSSFVPKANALNDEATYLLVQEGLQNIAAKLGIYPCILDACIFSSFDENKA